MEQREVTPAGWIMNDREIHRRLEFLSVTDDDIERIRRVAPYLKSLSGEFANRFYDHLLRFSELLPLLEGRLEHLKITQARYFEEMLTGPYDVAYVQNRARVGQAHERIGLEPKWYIGAFNLYFQIVSDQLRQNESLNLDEIIDTLLSLVKIIFFDVGLTIDVYIDTLIRTVREREEEIRRLQEAAIRELSAPVIEVWDQILVLPLIGPMTTRRAQEITERLLAAVVEKKAHVVIIDITGLPVMDTSTANHLFRTLQAVELLGATTIVTGIRPSIAQTVVNLGIDTSMLRTKARLADGLRMAFEILRIQQPATAQESLLTNGEATQPWKESAP